MIFQLKHKFTILVTLLCVAGFAGCASNGSQPQGQTAATNTNANYGSGIKAPPRVEIKTGDKIGVAECDEYLAKYEACAEKIPEPGRRAMVSSISDMRRTWITIAVNPETRTNLAAECKKSQEQTKQDLRSYACAW